MYCWRPSDSKFTQMSGSAPTRRQKSTNSPVPIWFDSTPPHSRLTMAGRALTWTDALSPAIEIRKDPAPSHHRRSKLLRHRHHIVAPLLGEVIPRSFDGSVGGPQRLHELHVKVGGQLEAENRVDDKSVRVERMGRRACTVAKRSRQGDASGRHSGFLEKGSSSHGRTLPEKDGPADADTTGLPGHAVAANQEAVHDEVGEGAPFHYDRPFEAPWHRGS